VTRAVLTFHGVDDSGSVLSFPPVAFRRWVEHLAAAAVPVVAFDELLRREHGVTITFDDGMRSVHEHALPVLREHGFPAHVFLATSYVGKDIGWYLAGREQRFAMLDWDEVEACAAGGIRAECHTVTHPDLTTLAPAAMVEECAAADDEIERRLGRRPTLFAFPFGRFDATVQRTLAPRYSGCFTTQLGYFTGAASLAGVPRLDTYYLQRPALYEHVLTAPARAYVALRAGIRAVRGRT
jgi:peptidoglycan/xylan/chitin deacetylase (PgdA/CDA1 family)